MVAVLCAAAFAVSGCGQTANAPSDQPITLVLDFTPNAVHAGIYLAVDRDYDGAQGITLNVRTPGASTDSLKTLLGHRADFAIVDIHDLALARQQGRDIVGVAPLVQVPLAAVLAQPDIRSPKDLEGKRAGVTGLPSDDAVLDTVVRGGGGNPKRVKRVTIGFNAVSALIGKRVSAATAFWNVEGLAVRAHRPGMHEFRVDQYGAPSYPELVIAVRGETLRENPATVSAVVTALRRGYAETAADPASAISAMTRQVPGLDAKPLTAQLAAVSQSFAQGVPAWGLFNRANLEAWSKWEARVGIVRKPPDVTQAFWLKGS